MCVVCVWQLQEITKFNTLQISLTFKDGVTSKVLEDIAKLGRTPKLWAQYFNISTFADFDDQTQKIYYWLIERFMIVLRWKFSYVICNEVLLTLLYQNLHV